MDEQDVENEFMDLPPPTTSDSIEPTKEHSSEELRLNNTRNSSNPAFMSSMWHNIQNQQLKKVAGDMIEHSNGTVERQLLHSSVEITSRSIQLTKSKPKHPPLPEVTEQQIRAKRNEALKVLDELRAEQLELLKQKRLSKLSNHPKQMERSSINEEEAKKVKELWRENRMLERRLRRKDLEIQQASIREQEMQARRSNQQLEDKKRKKREEIALRLQQLQKRKQQREQFIRETDKSLQEQLQRKYLADEMEENYKRKAEEQRRLLEQQVLLKKKSTTVQIPQLRQHEKRYKESVSRLKRDREKKLHEFKRRYVNDSMSRYEDLQIAQILRREEQEARRKHEEELEYKLQYRERIQSYHKQVKEKIPLPKLREKTEQTQSANKTGTLSENKSLSVQELNKLGNSYLQVAKKRAKKRESISHDETAVQLVAQPPRSVQRDYLKEIRLANPSPEKSSDMGRLKRILNSSSQHPSFEHITQALNLADKMQTLAGRNTKKLADCIHAKLEILKTIM